MEHGQDAEAHVGQYHVDIRLHNTQTSRVKSRRSKKKETTAEEIVLINLVIVYVWRKASFSALSLLVGHPACRNVVCWFVGGDDLTAALHVI